MLVISDSGKGGGRILFAAVFFSVCASVVTTLWVHSAIDHEEEGERAPAPSRVIIPDAEEEREAETIAELKETVSQLQKQVAGTEPEDAGVEPLLAIEQGERQIAIADEVARLTRRGDDVVPEIKAMLNVGRDQDWGGGFSFGGNMFKGYPRLRTALIDILRQIGTPLAKQSLLDSLGKRASTTDYRDLLMIYATTSDTMMIEGISAMIPDMLRRIRDGEDDEYGMLERNLTRWMKEQGIASESELLAQVSLKNLREGGRNRGAFELLLESDPDAACGVVAELAKTDPDLKALKPGLSIIGRQVRLSRITALCEFILGRLELSENGRTGFYHCLPRHPSTVPDSAEARKEDAQGLIALLERQLAVETSESARRALDSVIQALKATSG